jgi:hypothetical protein
MVFTPDRLSQKQRWYLPKLGLIYLPLLFHLLSLSPSFFRTRTMMMPLELDKWSTPVCRAFPALPLDGAKN